MSSAISSAAPARGVLVDLLPGARTRDALLVVVGACLTIIGAQVSIQVPPSPVPITAQTLGVVLAGGVLGARRGAASQALYLGLGIILPVYADGGKGFEVIWGPTGGYLVGFIVAAAAVGWCAEHGADRNVGSAIASFAVGQLLIFGIGVPWLQVSVGMSWDRAIHDGFAIFVVGGLFKAWLAGMAIPFGWRWVRRFDARK